MDNKTIAPTKPELLITVVNRNEAHYYEDLIQSFGANLQFTADGTGTANALLLQRLGLDTTEKAVIFSMVRADRLHPLMETLEARFRALRDGKGIAAAIPLNSMIGTLAYQFLIDARGKGPLGENV